MTWKEDSATEKIVGQPQHSRSLSNKIKKLLRNIRSAFGSKKSEMTGNSRFQKRRLPRIGVVAATSGVLKGAYQLLSFAPADKRRSYRWRHPKSPQRRTLIAVIEMFGQQFDELERVQEALGFGHDAVRDVSR